MGMKQLGLVLVVKDNYVIGVVHFNVKKMCFGVAKKTAAVTLWYLLSGVGFAERTTKILQVQFIDALHQN